METKNDVCNLDDFSKEDVAGMFAVLDYLSLRRKVADEIDEVLMEALVEPETEESELPQEIDFDKLIEAVIDIFERNFSLKPQGLLEIIAHR